MGFESGRISCRMFQLPRPLPEGALESFAEHAAPALNGASNAQQGWVTGRHLLDRQINETTAYYGGYLRLALLHAQKKIPSTLLQAECRMEELAQMAATDSTILNRKVRTEIRNGVQDRLLPNMPPQLKGIPFIYDETSQTIYAGALSIPQMDLFSVFFSHTLGFNLIPSLPEVLAAERKQVDVRDWHPTSFSPELEDDQVDVHPGRDFLTWLWFVGEARGGTVPLKDIGEVALLLEGPLTFINEGQGAHEIVLRKGEPLFSAEAKACLLAGKKLKRARLNLVMGEQVWECTLDADEFTFRSMSLPETESMDPVSVFQERMVHLDRFRSIFLALYDLYVEERRDTSTWKACRGEIHEWVKARSERK